MAYSPRRIDVHFHNIPHFYVEAARAARAERGVQTREEFPPWSPELSLEIMDRHGIDVAITSYTQGRGNFAVGEKHLELTRRFNDYSAGLCARWPKRFGAFAAVPMPDVKGSIAEINRALDQLKFDGVCLYTNYEGEYLGDPAFDPVMELLNDRQAVLFVHPAMHPSYGQLGLPWPAFMIEYPMDTTRAAVNMLFNGTIKRFPRVRIILAHAGGYLPYVAWRMSVTPIMQPRIPQLSPEEVYAGMRHYWYDTALSPGVETFGALNAVADPSKIVFGSDWPFTNVKVLPLMDKVAQAPGHLSETRRAAIDRGNAAALFPRFA